MWKVILVVVLVKYIVALEVVWDKHIGVLVWVRHIKVSVWVKYIEALEVELVRAKYIGEKVEELVLALQVDLM